MDTIAEKQPYTCKTLPPMEANSSGVGITNHPDDGPISYVVLADVGHAMDYPLPVAWREELGVAEFAPVKPGVHAIIGQNAEDCYPTHSPSDYTKDYVVFSTTGKTPSPAVDDPLINTAIAIANALGGPVQCYKAHKTAQVRVLGIASADGALETDEGCVKFEKGSYIVAGIDRPDNVWPINAKSFRGIYGKVREPEENAEARKSLGLSGRDLHVLAA